MLVRWCDFSSQEGVDGFANRDVDERMALRNRVHLLDVSVSAHEIPFIIDSSP